jgi:mannose-6-phosphate isomerase class I
MRGSSEAVRRTTQYLAPALRQETPPGVYDLYPAFSVGPGLVGRGFDRIARAIARSGQRSVIIDGFVGVLWEPFIEELTAALSRCGLSSSSVSVQRALLPSEEIDRLIGPYLGGDDPLYGTRAPLSLSQFFSRERLLELRRRDAEELLLVYGAGAALAQRDGFLIYVEVPKNELQFRSRAGSVTNLGASAPSDPRSMYKRFYFVDWPVLNRHRRAILRDIDLMVDTQRPVDPTSMRGKDLREGLHAMARSSFRVRPWFEPGPWGGQWIKRTIPGLASEAQNYAWSFELISPENGVALESDGCMLEVSFDFLMLHNHRQVLGDFASLFGFEFPIRYDFLDTVGGGNLSVQCHPRPRYIHEEFGETFTQDEAYYILDARPGARVYLGFTEAADPATFRAELERSVREGIPVDIERHVQTLPARKHDLFLIPNGTIHCSGVNTLVLEISATPYIFTFKMYDWVRMDLDGRPRTLNIERAFANLHFHRRGSRVTHELVSRPRLLAHGSDWQIFHLPTHPEHFYDVHRVEFMSSVKRETQGSCHVMNLVEGEAILVETGDGRRQRFNYAETFIVPAAAGRYRLRNAGRIPAKVVTTFLKPSARPFARPEGATRGA